MFWWNLRSLKGCNSFKYRKIDHRKSIDFFPKVSKEVGSILEFQHVYKSHPALFYQRMTLKATSLKGLWGHQPELTAKVSVTPCITGWACKGINLSSLLVSVTAPITGLGCKGIKLNSLLVSVTLCITGWRCKGINLSSLLVSVTSCITGWRCKCINLSSLLHPTSHCDVSGVIWAHC